MGVKVMVCACPEVETGVLAAVRLSDGFSASVAVSVSLPTGEMRMRWLKVAEPPARFFEVVPFSSEALSAMEMELLAAVAARPLSVNSTTGAGTIAVPGVASEGSAGGSVMKDRE